MLFDKLGREAHLWIVRPESITEGMTLAACMDTLSDQEQQRYRRFLFEKDRHRYLVSHALVRNVLSNYAEIAPAAWSFSESGHGRPEVANPGLSDIRFNLSHTSGLAACLVTYVRDCGVDVERVHTRYGAVGVAKRMFSSAEVEDVQRLEGRDQLNYFFTRWTLREAYTKALGTGITFPTHKLNFIIRSATDIDIEFQAEIEDNRKNWQFAIFSLGDEHIAAAAIKRPDQNDIKIVIHNMNEDLTSYSTQT
ncbi:MAG: 4'-phosphopantetheinyl transferase superfamily protein [Halobacteria archaeon]|nr:4'-phosphopantetheinyl transferase superfamily protein [Halobacteria archaeon]